MRCVCICVVGFALLLGLIATPALDAAQQLCSGDVCAAHITRSAKNHWELVLRLKDSQGHRALARLDCRTQALSGDLQALDRAAVDQLGLRACHLLPQR